LETVKNTDQGQQKYVNTIGEKNMGYGDFGGGGGGRSFGGPREMHKATCADCGKECEVPFKPSADRPVYCRDCFGKHKKF
jgi:CxxC-x17-CxxC domain-containing protein